MPILLPPPPPAVQAALRQALPPLAFSGFRAGMPLPEARKLIQEAGGTLNCRPTSDPRMRDCTGALPLKRGERPLGLLISSIHDSAAVIVLSARALASISATWVGPLITQFGQPNRDSRPGGRKSWQWIRRSQMLRVVERKSGPWFEASGTLTDGPLLDGLGPPEKKKPD